MFKSVTGGLPSSNTACRVDTYQMTVLPLPKSSDRPHTDRKPRPITNFCSDDWAFIL